MEYAHVHIFLSIRNKLRIDDQCPDGCHFAGTCLDTDWTRNNSLVCCLQGYEIVNNSTCQGKIYMCCELILELPNSCGAICDMSCSESHGRQYLGFYGDVTRLYHIE
jgi:hypothetical protein